MSTRAPNRGREPQGGPGRLDPDVEAMLQAQAPTEAANRVEFRRLLEDQRHQDAETPAGRAAAERRFDEEGRAIAARVAEGQRLLREREAEVERRRLARAEAAVRDQLRRRFLALPGKTPAEFDRRYPALLAAWEAERMAGRGESVPEPEVTDPALVAYEAACGGDW